jgi:hypothetical protein
MDALDYENNGFVKGATARIKNSGQGVILVSNPKTDDSDLKTRAWVALEFDTHVRYLALVEDLELK